MTIEEARAAWIAAIAAAQPLYLAAQQAAQQAYEADVAAATAVYKNLVALGEDPAFVAKNWSVAIMIAQDKFNVALGAAFDVYRKATQPAADTLAQAYAQQIDLKQQEGTTTPRVQGGQPVPLHDPFGGPG